MHLQSVASITEKKISPNDSNVTDKKHHFFLSSSSSSSSNSLFKLGKKSSVITIVF